VPPEEEDSGLEKKWKEGKEGGSRLGERRVSLREAIIVSGWSWR